MLTVEKSKDVAWAWLRQARLSEKKLKAISSYSGISVPELRVMRLVLRGAARP